jgi:hypothetical protein
MPQAIRDQTFNQPYFHDGGASKSVSIFNESLAPRLKEPLPRFAPTDYLHSRRLLVKFKLDAGLSFSYRTVWTFDFVDRGRLYHGVSIE